MGRTDEHSHRLNSGSGQSVTNAKAAEAILISQATSTAMVAAKSILMSGGSEEVALKTAKAAAESVLRPTGSELETLSVRSTTFLRRRKAKRQPRKTEELEEVDVVEGFDAVCLEAVEGRLGGTRG